VTVKAGADQSGPAGEAARSYFGAIARRDLDAALACWRAGGIDHLAPVGELQAPDGMREYFTALFTAFPDFRYEVLALVANREQAAIRWRATGTFTGGPFTGFLPNGATLEAEGCDLLRVDADGLIVRNDSYWDDAAVARSIGLLPPHGGGSERMLTALFNLKTRLTRRRVRPG
jgi:predicted ester cyclase